MADETRPTSPYEWIGRLSAGALLATALVTSQMGVWVWGRDLAAAKADASEWKALALKGMHVAEGRIPGVVGMAPPSPASSEPTKAEVQRKLDEIENQNQQSHAHE